MLSKPMALLCLLLLSTILIAQPGYRPGRVYLRGGTSAEGLIRFYPCETDKTVRFKYSPGDRTQEYTKDEVDSFTVEGEGHFVCADIEFSNYYTKQGSVFRRIYSKREFLQLLICGDSMSLYLLPSEDRFYVGRGRSQNLTELIYCYVSLEGGDFYLPKVFQPNPKNIAINDPNPQYFGYRQQLEKMVGQKDPFLPWLARLEYSQDSLVAFVRSYNTSRHLSYEQSTGTQKRQIHFLVGVGAAKAITLLVPAPQAPLKERMVNAVIWPAIFGAVICNQRDPANIWSLRGGFSYFHQRAAYSGLVSGNEKVNYRFSSENFICSATLLARFASIGQAVRCSGGVSLIGKLGFVSGADATWSNSWYSTGEAAQNYLDCVPAVGLNLQLLLRRWECFLHWEAIESRLKGENPFYQVGAYRGALSLNYYFP